jgi:hypothetical protein
MRGAVLLADPDGTVERTADWLLRGVCIVRMHEDVRVDGDHLRLTSRSMGGSFASSHH